MERYDQQEIYCRKLGHHLKFEYCRTEHDGKPCPLIFDCWYERIPIGDYMRENFDPKEVEYLTRPSQNRVLSLVELIQKAQRRNQDK